MHAHGPVRISGGILSTWDARVLSRGCGEIESVRSTMELTNIREILEPLPITFQSQSPTILRSRKASPKYVKANQRWWLEVQFNSDIDLVLFEKTIAGSPVRLIEFQNRFFIEEPRTPDVDDMSRGLGLVSRYAEDELPRLNAAVKVLCPQYVPATLRCIVYLDDRGQGHPITFAEGVVHGRDEEEAIRDFLRGPNTAFPGVLHLYAQHIDVREALFYFGSPGNPWSNLYKAREIIADAMGGDDAILASGWCSRKALARFDRTANHQEAIGKFSRHARIKAVPPPNPLEERDARELIRKLLRDWIQMLLSRTPRIND